MHSVRMVSIASFSMGSLSRAGNSVLAVWVMSTFLGARPASEVAVNRWSSADSHA